MPKTTSEDDFDEDHTDELPVLVETVALQEAGDLHVPHEDTAQQAAVFSMGEHGIEALNELAQRAEQIPALEAQIRVLTDSTRDLEQLVAEKSRRIEELDAALASSRRSKDDSGVAERHLATQLAIRDARLAELTETVQRLQLEAAASLADIERLRGLAESGKRAADAMRRELAAKPASNTPADGLQALREDHAALVAYIAGRRVWWDELQAKNASLAARAEALEQELLAGAERLASAEELAARESSRAVELRAELVDYARRVDELERELKQARAMEAPEQSPPAESGPKAPELAQPAPSAHPAREAAAANVAAEQEAPPILTEAVDGAAPVVETIAQLEGEVEYKRQQVAAQLVELHDREHRLRAATSELEGMRGELASVRTELESSRSSIAGLERAVAEKDRALEARDTRIATLHEELKQRVAAVDKRGTAELSLTALDIPVDDGSSLPALICLTGDAPKRFALTKKTTIVGRGPQCDLQIVTHTVSREHARLTMNGGVTLIEDLGSRNGVFVNAVRVDRRQLRQGDLVTIGETEFRFIESMAH
jgi:chromosome segregation ATPase